VRCPDQLEEAFALAWMEKKYSLPGPNASWSTRVWFEQCLQDLDFTSTPGLPYMHEKPTIGQWLGWDQLGHFDPDQVHRLWMDVQDLMRRVESGEESSHIFRCFVKDEPHTKKKISEQRWRLIMCAGLDVQMLWRMALKEQNDWLNGHPYSCPSSHGLVFCYGGWRRFKAHAASKGLRYSRDISAWDVNAPGWVFRVIKRWRQRASSDRLWQKTLDWLYCDAFEQPKIKFSNGLVVQQRYSGTMKSGLFVTIADNSAAMNVMHVLASVRSGQPIGEVWSTGDDVLHSHISDAYLQELELLGCRVKEWEEKLQFMGTDFSDKPTPVYLAKHIVNFMTSKEFVAERLDSYARLWCHSPWFDFWHDVAFAWGLTLRSREFYQLWFDSPYARLLNQ